MNINENKPEFEKIIEFLKKDIAGLRTSRASTAMVEDVQVEAYGSHQPLKAVASISVADPRTLNIDPWDKSLLAVVEKGIRESGLGVNPINDGHLIRLPLPELTAERRQELVKVLRQKLENARISIRRTREEARGLITLRERNKEIGEDEKFRFYEELDRMVKIYNDLIKEIGEKKEEEIAAI